MLKKIGTNYQFFWLYAYTILILSYFVLQINTKIVLEMNHHFSICQNPLFCQYYKKCYRNFNEFINISDNIAIGQKISDKKVTGSFIRLTFDDHF